MTTVLLSFRMSGEDLSWLEKQALEGEHLNITAKRLILKMIPDREKKIPITKGELEVIVSEIKDQLLEELQKEVSGLYRYIDSKE